MNYLQFFCVCLNNLNEKNNRKGKGVGFYRIPKDPPERRRRWIAAIRRVRWQPTEETRLCGLHFVSGMLVN